MQSTDFTQHPDVQQTLSELKAQFSKREFTRIVVLAMILGPTTCPVYFSLPSANPGIFRWLMMTTFLLMAAVISVAGIMKWLFGKFKKTGWGINPGNNFKNWIATILKENDVKNLADWQIKIHEMPPDLHMRTTRTENISDMKPPEVCLITSDITTQVKVEFPRMACLYWRNFAEVNPAEFVRASMSIPVFFQAAKVTGIPVHDPEVIRCWKEMLSYKKEIPRTA